MRLSRADGVRRLPNAAEPAILFGVADSTFAIASSAVEEIRSLDGLIACSIHSPHSNLQKITFVFEREGKTYLVVDSNPHFRMFSAKAERLLVLRNLPVAVLVGKIDRICELKGVRKLPQAFHGEEKAWYRGLTVINNQIVPVVNPLAFLSKAEVAIAQTEVMRMGLFSAPKPSIRKGTTA